MAASARGARRGGRRRRILVGGIAHETNTFSRFPTDLDQFRERLSISGREILYGLAGTRTVLGGFLDGAAALGAEAIPLIYASAMPGGIVTRAAYAELRGSLLHAIADAPADAVLLALHGAMVAEDVPDAEADLLHAVRALVGSHVPIVATLDSHANISQATVAAADVLVGYMTYPHVDTYERGREAAAIVGRLWESGKRATAARAAPPMLTALPPQCTCAETPMRALVARAAREASRPGVLNVTVAGGFPYSDVPDAGLRVVATTLDDPARARKIATGIAREAWERHTDFLPSLTAVPDAIARVRTAARYPVILSDSGDNPGAGAPCDGTTLLRALLEAGIRDTVVGVIADPETVARAVAAGTGTRISVRLGGKSDDRHGAPILHDALVERIADGIFTNTGPMGTGGRTRMGRTALLALDGVRVIVTEQRVQALDLSLFRSVGVEPTAVRALALKSSVHYRAAFAPIAAAIIEVDTPGISNPDLTQFAYRHVRRPVWPLDADARYDEEE